MEVKYDAKKQYCIGTRNVRSKNQSKLEVVLVMVWNKIFLLPWSWSGTKSRIFLRYDYTSLIICCCYVASVVSDSERSHRGQLTRIPHPWDSPGKNTGVGCHFLLQCMKVKSESEVAQLCPTLSDPMDCSLPGSSIYGIFQARVLEWGANDFSELHVISSIYAISSNVINNSVKRCTLLSSVYIDDSPKLSSVKDRL